MPKVLTFYLSGTDYADYTEKSKEIIRVIGVVRI